jgi:hypothetical protein
MNIYNRYAPFIRDFIYQNNWESLRAVQVAAGDIIFNTDHNLLLSASTASGKTEAAFFPILTLFYEDPPKSVGALYIGPLKALINDQFMRLNDLCREADIPVWHWHGDVAQSHKEKLQKKPLRHPPDHSGILGGPAYAQTLLYSKALLRSALYRYRRDPFSDAGRSGRPNPMLNPASITTRRSKSPEDRSFGNHWGSGSCGCLFIERNGAEYGCPTDLRQGNEMAALHGTLFYSKPTGR